MLKLHSLLINSATLDFLISRQSKFAVKLYCVLNSCRSILIKKIYQMNLMVSIKLTNRPIGTKTCFFYRKLF